MSPRNDKWRMALSLALLFMASVSVADAPFFLRSSDKDQDLGGLNSNFRVLETERHSFDAVSVSSGDLPVDGQIDAWGQTIINVGNPVNNQDAATRGWILSVFLSSETFAWNPGSAADGSGAVTTFQLTSPGIIIGVDIPQAPASGVQWGTIDRFNTSFGVYKNDTGNALQVVSWLNNTGGAYDPPSANWIVWYIKQ